MGIVQQQAQSRAGVPISGTIVFYGRNWRNRGIVTAYSEDFTRVCLDTGRRLAWWPSDKIRQF
jgi:hypothetical protein